MSWEPELWIDGASYQRWVEGYVLEPDLPPARAGETDDALHTFLPGTSLYYSNLRIGAGEWLETRLQRRAGRAAFDADVAIPCLRERHAESEDDLVWMSLTPLEVFSLRSGTRRAQGHTVVAGLGLGYQLIEVSRKRAVHTITLIERDAALVDWMLPRIAPRLGDAELQVRVGDAEEIVPTLQADVALVDTFPSYGGNRARFPQCPQIQDTWIWGAAGPAA